MSKSPPKGYGFGTFQGVFTPSILTIIGVVMYLRFGWMLGHVGLPLSLVIVTLGSLITFLTGLSISSLATNMRMEGGGAYFMLSRSFGLEAGAAMGIPLALSQAIGVSFYVAGFAEALTSSGLPFVSGCDVRIVGLITLTILALVATISANIALKMQYVIMVAIVLSLVSFFCGSSPELVAPVSTKIPSLDFWVVFAIFFPAVTGILSGVGMSGDLKNPSRAIPLGTLAAVLTGYVIYMVVPIVLHHFVMDENVLKADTMILQKCARWPFLILLGVWAATLSSAIGSFLCAPRVVQALSNDKILPRVLGRGYGPTHDPRVSSFVCFLLAALGLWFGNINVIAPILTMFNLTTYGLLNFSAAMEETMGNPSWRPTFRVKPIFSFLGFIGCVCVMFLISPGWTFVALACEGVIYWLVKRRALRARWGDMRTGLLMFLIRMGFRLLLRHKPDGRNWRPNLLVFSSMPIRYPELLSLARAISGNRGFTTVASVMSQEIWTPVRADELKKALRRSIDKYELEAQIRIHASSDTFTGMKELIRVCGFGPLTPNTILMGWPAKCEQSLALASLVSLTYQLERNMALIASHETRPSYDERIDIWWRGQKANGSFMLALAYLAQRSLLGKMPSIRLCTIVKSDATAQEMRNQLKTFLQTARVKAEIHVIISDGCDVGEIISEHSANALWTYIGLRPPQIEESFADYAIYLGELRQRVSSVPRILFSLACEKIDFSQIFGAP